MEKSEKKSFWSRILGRGNKSKAEQDGKRLYSNSRKTKDKIKLALLDLLKSEEISQINITSLVKAAGVYRATFYLHYKSLQDVVVDIEKDLYACYNDLRQYLDEIDLYNNLSTLARVISENINMDRSRLRIIISANCFGKLLLNLRELLKDILITNFEKFDHVYPNSILDISIFSGGLVFAYRDWLKEDGLDLSVLENTINQLGGKIFDKNIK